MSIWKKPVDLDTFNATSKNTLIEHLNIVYTEVNDNSLVATMPVCHFTHQPLGVSWRRIGSFSRNAGFTSSKLLRTRWLLLRGAEL